MHADQKYIIALREGNNALLKEAYHKCAKQVQLLVLNNSGTIQEAKDLFQEALLVVFYKAQDEDFVLTCQFCYFVLSICKNKWYDVLRKKGVEAKVIQEFKRLYNNTSPSIEELIIQAEEEQKKQVCLDKSFKKLSTVCQNLLDKVKKGKTTAEIVNIMQMPTANTVHRRKAACIKRWTELYHSALKAY